jgi:NTE family protein
VENHAQPRKKIALALGSGSARGIAHIGVIQRLAELGIKPDILCGTSAGSVVAACYLTGHLDHFAEWLRTLSNAQILRYLSINLTASGGMADASRLIDFFKHEYGNPLIEDLDLPFAAVATDLERGREIWLQRGPIWEAVRASIALPGILTPVAMNDGWLVDGGLVNPVPVSVCRALGADIVIGIDLNSDLVGRHRTERRPATPLPNDNEELVEEEESEDEKSAEPQNDSEKSLPWLDEDSQLSAAFNRISHSVRDFASSFRSGEPAQGSHKAVTPGTMNVMMSSINIMQDRITRSRLAGEPADVMLWPRLGNIGLMEFNRVDEAITGGRDAVERMLPAIRHAFAAEGIALSPESGAPDDSTNTDS